MKRVDGRYGTGTRSAPGAEPPADAREALARARRHARAAARESVSALAALLDAASLAAAGVPAARRPELALLVRALSDLGEVLGADGDEGSPLLDAVADALDAEIGRWEERAERDADARAVLRAWLGLRELLWELGVRRRTRRGARPRRAPAARPDAAAAAHAAGDTGRAHAASDARTVRGGADARPARRRTLQRVPLEG